MSSNDPSTADADADFHVPRILDLLGGLVYRYRSFWLWLGRWETRLLAHELEAVPLAMPIYVTDLARSGSTLLHEMVAAHPGVATHRIKDYPMVFTPCWWRRAVRPRPMPPRERAHRDKVMITPDSPDSTEEMLWMAFFPRCHDPLISNVLTEADSHPAFETFYRAHIRKLLLAEHASRYVAKANHHITRLAYLVDRFPDVRFIIPVRAPAGHIASLMRQHEWFTAGHRKYPRALAFMQRSGHFEFGLDRRPINLGDGQRVQEITLAWANGEEVRGWARYWDMVYGYLARLLQSNSRVRAAALTVRFEDLCAAPAETIRAVLEHCRLPDTAAIINRYALGIHRPDYYKSSLSADELAIIQEETAGSASQWGY